MLVVNIIDSQFSETARTPDTAHTSFFANPGSAELDQIDEFDADMDDEASIASDEEELGEEIENKENEALFAKSVDNATRALLDGDDLEEILPNPDLVYDAEGETMRKRELISGIQPPGNFTDMNQQFALIGSRLLVTEMMMVMERHGMILMETSTTRMWSRYPNDMVNGTQNTFLSKIDPANASPFAPSGSRRGAIKGLCGDPAFANDLAYEPAKLFRGGRTDVYRDTNSPRKHLIGRVQEVTGDEQFDIKIQSLPPAFGFRHYSSGRSALTQVPGIELKHIARICLVGKIESGPFIREYPMHLLVSFVSISKKFNDDFKAGVR
ncbi:hypothetical protein F5890DRAFT_1476491 [Lentinula detonsa]|uniref:Uncharacterized protein n=1 Tax=Lentinula detonsa TaxID=2804962 RepID=A0AA38PUG9_9AGAR|nr:hypothetical protein F5890DRAFT_1476491 [Lentinula detonsa]